MVRTALDVAPSVPNLVQHLFAPCVSPSTAAPVLPLGPTVVLPVKTGSVVRGTGGGWHTMKSIEVGSCTSYPAHIITPTQPSASLRRGQAPEPPLRNPAGCGGIRWHRGWQEFAQISNNHRPSQKKKGLYPAAVFGGFRKLFQLAHASHLPPLATMSSGNW